MFRLPFVPPSDHGACKPEARAVHDFQAVRESRWERRLEAANKSRLPHLSTGSAVRPAPPAGAAKMGHHRKEDALHQKRKPASASPDRRLREAIRTTATTAREGNSNTRAVSKRAGRQP